MILELRLIRKWSKWRTNLRIVNIIKLPLKTIIWTTFAQVFFGEWNDKSLYATGALAGSSNGIFVFLGSTTALSLTSLLAVTAGSYLSDKILNRVLGLIGGALNLIFAIKAFYDSYTIVNKWIFIKIYFKYFFFN